MICCIFPWVERSLLFCVISFRMCNALWYIVLYVSACGMRYHNFVFYIPACGMCSGNLCYIFYMWNALWYFVFFFMHVECLLVFCVIYFCMWNVLWFFLLYFSTCGIHSGVVDFRVIYFPRVERSFLYCIIYFLSFSLHFIMNCSYLDFISKFLFQLFETKFDLRAMVLWTFVLYFSGV